MGRQCAEEGRWEEARPLLERALTLDPEMTAALLTAASLEFSLDHFARARHYSERALALNSQDADAHTLLGNIALAERNPAAALASYRHALDSGGDAVDLHFNTGLAHLFMGEAEKASHIFTRLTDEDPTNHRAWDALGCARRVLKDYTGAVVAFTRALQLDTNSCDARDHLAQVLMDTGNPSRASQILESVLAMEPHRHTTRQLLGMAYAALQDFQRATVCWEELIDKGMASADIYHYLANAYIHLDDTARARKTLQTLISLYPEHVSGHLQLALLLLEDGEQVQGMHHLELARELDPHNPVIAHALLTAEAYSLGASPVAER
jgi:tetratricopeptide (TPR) repeat protein